MVRRGLCRPVSLTVLALTGLALVSCGDDDDATQTAKGVSEEETGEATVEELEYAYKVTGTLRSGGALRIRNTGKEFHMMGLAKLKAGKTFEEAKAALLSEDEADDEQFLEQAFMPGHFSSPGTDVKVTVPDLQPGTYAMACYVNVAGEETPHLFRGMINELQVVSGAVKAPAADAVYVADSGQPVRGPATLSAGRHVLKIEAGAGGDDLEPGLYRLNEGATAEQFAAAAKLFDEGPLPVDAPSKLPGQIIIGLFDFADQPAVYLDVELQRGTYVLVAENSDDEDEPLLPVEMIQIAVS